MIQPAANSFHCSMEIPVHFRCKLISHLGGEVHNQWVLCNFDFAMCTIGFMQTYDGGMSYNWNYQSTHAIREHGSGLQYFDNHGQFWRYFDDGVQEAYAQFLLEKEIK